MEAETLRIGQLVRISNSKYSVTVGSIAVIKEYLYSGYYDVEFEDGGKATLSRGDFSVIDEENEYFLKEKYKDISEKQVKEIVKSNYLSPKSELGKLSEEEHSGEEKNIIRIFNRVLTKKLKRNKQ